MPTRLRRLSGSGYLHFITTSCYRRRSLLGTAHRRNLFLKILEEVRRSYRFAVIGYVVMPEHIHLLISEPERGTPSTVMQVLKQRFARRVLRELRRRTDSAQASLWQEALDTAMYGSGATMIFWCEPSVNGLRNYDTCTAIR